MRSGSHVRSWALRCALFHLGIDFALGSQPVFYRFPVFSSTGLVDLVSTAGDSLYSGLGWWERRRGWFGERILSWVDTLFRES